MISEQQREQVMEQAMEQMISVFKLISKDECTEAIMTMLWNIKNKAKEKGFTDEEAMAITLSFAKNNTK